MQYIRTGTAPLILANIVLGLVLSRMMDTVSPFDLAGDQNIVISVTCPGPTRSSLHEAPGRVQIRWKSSYNRCSTRGVLG